MRVGGVVRVSIDLGCLLFIRLLIEQIARMRARAIERGDMAAIRVSTLLVPIPMGLLLALAVVGMPHGPIAAVALLAAGAVGIAALARSW